MNLVKVNEKELQVKEWNNERVITAWDIAKLHEREVREVTQNFNYVKEKLILNEDYFLVPRNKISESKILIQDFIPNNVKEIPIFTESGYLMLVKSFKDDLSWKIQRVLVNNYFKMKQLKEEIVKGYEPTEYEKDLLKLEKAKLLKDVRDSVRIDSYKDILNSIIVKETTGEMYLPLPKIEQLSYSATEICKMLLDRYDLKVSVQKLGRVANKENLKIEGNGIWVLDKKKYSEGTTETFRYYEKMVGIFYKLLKGEK